MQVGPKPLLTEFGIHYRLESCAFLLFFFNAAKKKQNSGGAKSLLKTLTSRNTNISLTQKKVFEFRQVKQNRTDK